MNQSSKAHNEILSDVTDLYMKWFVCRFLCVNTCWGEGLRAKDDVVQVCNAMQHRIT
jgi:hypothetical protein